MEAPKQLDITSLEKTTTKTKLAELLSRGNRSIQDYHNVAFASIPDYRNEFLKRSDGKFLTRSALSRYQCWCICQIRDFLSVFNCSKSFLKEYIATNANFSSRLEKDWFLSIYPEDTSTTNREYECQILLQAETNNSAANEQPLHSTGMGGH